MTLCISVLRKEEIFFDCFNEQAHYLMSKSVYLYYLNIVILKVFFSVCLKHCFIYYIDKYLLDKSIS